MTLEQATKYLRNNKEILDMSEVARRLKMDRSWLHRAINGIPGSRGYADKIPKRCLPELEQIIKELSAKPKTK